MPVIGHYTNVSHQRPGISDLCDVKSIGFDAICSSVVSALSLAEAYCLAQNSRRSFKTSE